MVRIPSEYQEVEYIESTGTQYFWTDIDIQDGLTVDSVQTIATGNDSYLFGGRGDSNTASKTCFNGGYGRRVQGAYPDNYYLCGTLVFDNQTKYHIVSVHSNSRRMCIINGTEVANVATDAFVETTGKCLCFGWNKCGTPLNHYKGKVYSIKVSKGDALLADYIPCYRISDNVAGMYDTVSKQFYTNDGTGEFLIGNPVSYDTTNLLESRRRILLNTPHLESLTGTQLQFTTDMTSKLKECRIHFTPIQEGTGDPSPDNVRPIHGWDGVTVNVANEYITPKSWEQGAINGAANTVNVGRTYAWLKTSSNTRIRLVYLIALNETHQYKVTWNTAEYELCAQPYDSDGLSVLATSPFNIWQTDYFVFSTPNVAIALRRKDGASITPSEMETANVEITEATVTQITIPFPQTIYGGYVDLVKGEVVEEIVGYNADDIGFKIGNPDEYNGEYGQRFQNNLSITFSDDTNDVSMCNILPCVKQTNSSTYAKSVTWLSVFRTGGNNIIYGCLNKNYLNGDNSIENIKTFLRTNGFLCTVKLATPTTYPLDPVTIRTLRGLNNIWSDANGNIEVKFWTH